MDIHAPRLSVSPRLRDLMAYPRFAGTPRVLVLENEYWLDGACVRAARALGWETVRVPVRMQGEMPREQVAAFLSALTEFRPDWVLSINLSGMDTQGLFAGLFADLGMPYAAWFVDDPRTILMGNRAYASDFAVAFTWEAAYREYLVGCGFAEAHTLPLAVDEHCFSAQPADGWTLPPSFVGNSMVDFAAREWHWFAGHPDLASNVEDAFARGAVTRENFAHGVEALLGAHAVPLDAEAARHVELYCFVEGTRRLRQLLADAVCPLGAVMHGDAGWHGRAAHVGPPVHYFNELPAHYRATPVSLNATSVQMATAVNQRVFDCPAAGGFLLTDAQASLRTLFAEDEVATYRDFTECAELLQQYLAAPGVRTEMIRRARTRIFGEHTYRHRLQAMLGILRERFAGG